MSYDLMVFEISKAPMEKSAFMDWYGQQTEWSEDHGYDDPAVFSPALQAFYAELIQTYPNINGELSNDEFDRADEEGRLTEYSIGRGVVYAAFSWGQAESAYQVMRELCSKHGVGFFDASSSDADVILPDGKKL